MKQILNLLILLFCVLSLAHTKFEPTQTSAVPDGVLDIEYSPDQKIVIFSTQKFVQIHDGVTTAFRSNITFEQDFSFSSLAFSQDTSKFAIGFTSQVGLTTYRIYNTYNLELIMQKTVGNSRSVNSLCFTADNKNLVLGGSNGQISFITLGQTSEFSSFGFGVPITSVACSPYRSLQFSVAAGLAGTQKKLSTFNYNPVTKYITQIKVYAGISQDDLIFDLIYTPSGTEIMYCGSSNQIQIKSIDENKSRSITWPVQYVNLHKIRSSLKGDIIAATTGTGKLVIQKTTLGQNAVQVQQFDVLIPTFGLGPSGANAAYININKTGSVLGQCPNGQYLNDVDDTCSSCNPECSQCLSLPTSCYSCIDGHYLTQSYQCLNCVARCKTCSNGQVCQICNDPFTVTGLGCGCKLGTFIDNDKCTTCTEGCLDCSDLDNCKKCDSDYELVNGFCNYNGGFPTWAVVLLVILGITVIAAVAGVAYLKFKRSQKQSPLLNDQQETPEKQTA